MDYLLTAIGIIFTIFSTGISIFLSEIDMAIMRRNLISEEINTRHLFVDEVSETRHFLENMQNKLQSDTKMAVDQLSLKIEADWSKIKLEGTNVE